MKAKYKAGGLDGWLEHEILEFLLSYALARKDTKPLAKELLRTYKNLQGVLDADIAGLVAIPGLSEHSVLLIRLVKDIGRVYLKDVLKTQDLITSPAAAVSFLKACLQGSPDEVFFALFLDASQNVIAEERLQTGTVNRSAVYPRKVVERALHHKATGVIIAHNHPGGSLKPSDEDRHATAAVVNALHTVDVALHDHIIITVSGYYSWKEHNLL